MLSLADVQTQIRNAVVLGTSDVVPLLVGGRDPATRLTIHHRHYQASLVEAILRRFPALCWLVGESLMRTAAKDFIRRHPPSAPCIGEYAETFPDFLSRCAEAEHLPYLIWFARCEWHLGQITLEIDRPPMTIEKLSAFDPERLVDLILTMQPGLRYMEAPWPVDDLIGLYLTESLAERYVMEPAHLKLQFQGARGVFRMSRLDAGTFAFRLGVFEGLTLGQAAEKALEMDPTFDIGSELLTLVNEGLITDVALATPGESS